MSKRKLTPRSMSNSRNFKSGSLSLFDINKTYQSKYFGYDCRDDEEDEIKPIRNPSGRLQKLLSLNSTQVMKKMN